MLRSKRAELEPVEWGGQRWEYRAVKVRVNHEGNLERELNELGAQGFELVAVRDDVLLLKRPEPAT